MRRTKKKKQKKKTISRTDDDELILSVNVAIQTPKNDDDINLHPTGNVFNIVTESTSTEWKKKKKKKQKKKQKKNAFCSALLSVVT